MFAVAPVFDLIHSTDEHLHFLISKYPLIENIVNILDIDELFVGKQWATLK